MMNNQEFLQTAGGTRQMPIQEDFYLLDVVGGSSFTALHPSRPVIAYNSGCMIIVYDLMTDQKINLVHHQHEIYALAFSPPGAGNSQAGGDFLISIDFDRNELGDSSSPSNSTMCLWNWQKGQCLQEIQIPRAAQGGNSTFLLQPALPSMQGSGSGPLPRLIQITFEKVGGSFFVLESGSSDLGGGYKASLWTLNRHQRIEMLAQMDLELQYTAHGLVIIPGKTSSLLGGGLNQISSAVLLQPSQYSSATTQYMTSRLRFATLEKQCIKVWEYSQGRAELVKKILIKQTMKQCVISELTGFFLILGDNGKVLILDQEGEFVSTVTRDVSFFTVIGTAHDKLLLGTERGTVCVYHMASLKFINEIPYQLSLLQNFQLNQATSRLSPQKKSIGGRMGHNVLIEKASTMKNELEAGLDQFSLFKMGPPVVQVQTTSNMRFLLIKYQDQSVAMIDRTVNTPQQAIMGYQFGHFQKVSSLQWWTKPLKRTKQLAGGEPLGGTGALGSKGGISDTFVTCGHDMSVFVWKHFGDRWSFSFIDVVKCFDQTLSCQRKQTDQSTLNLKLTAICIYPRQPFIIVGDNKGIARIFQISHGEKALFVASHQLQTGQEFQSSEEAIIDIHITADEQYAVVAFQSGLICCYDVKNSFHLIGQVEKDAQRFCYANQLQVQLKVLEVCVANADLVSFSTYDNRRGGVLGDLNTSLETNAERIIAASRGGKSNTPYYPSNQFRVISTTSPNCLSLKAVEVRGNKLHLTPLAQFTVDEGRVAGFDIHPSRDYILITSTHGRIYVYRIDTGELRGTIKIPLHAKGCVVDPSGLYVVVQVPPFKQKYTINIMSPSAQDDIFSSEDQYQVSTHESDIERTTLLVFEIGTGIAAAEIKSIFEISAMQFSEDGRFLALGSSKGSVCVWALGEHLYQNVKQVLDSMQLQPDFWCNYPIFLADYGKYGMEESPMQLPMPVEDQIDAPETFHLYGNDHQQQQFSPHEQAMSQSFTVGGSNRYPPLLNQGIQTSDYSRQGAVAGAGQAQQYINQGLQTESFKKSQVKPPLMNKQLAINPASSVSQRVQQSPYQQQQQMRQHQQQQQEKFYRKTFVEDQFTQMTPHQSRVMNQQQQNFQNSATQQRSAQMQTGGTQRNVYAADAQTSPQPFRQDFQRTNQPLIGSAGLPDIPEYGNNGSAQRGPLRQRTNPMMASQSSLGTPNRAELLYRDAYTQPPQNQLMQQQVQQQQPFAYQPPPAFQASRISPIQQQPPPLDYIDRTQYNTQGRSMMPQQQPQRQMLFEMNTDLQQQLQGNPLTYEENLDAAQLYNPSAAVINPHELPAFIGTREIPLSSISASPGKPVPGRMQPRQDILEQQRKLLSDPIDIDDDVSDHGPESIEQQLKELDCMNKYLQNVRVPTRFADDAFMSVHGQNPDQAYTLERLRQEERNLQGNGGFEVPTGEAAGEEKSNIGGGSTYDVVEEMYENMNSFDQRLKTMQQMKQMQPQPQLHYF